MTSGMKSDEIRRLVMTADCYCAGSGESRNALSKQLFGRGGQIDDLAAGRRDMTTRTAEDAFRWLSDNWPADAAWPEGVGRPAAQEAAS